MVDLSFGEWQALTVILLILWIALMFAMAQAFDHRKPRTPEEAWREYVKLIEKQQ